MPVINGFEEGDGIRDAAEPEDEWWTCVSCGRLALCDEWDENPYNGEVECPACGKVGPHLAGGIREPDGGDLECERCGRIARANDWAVVLFDCEGLDPKRCPDCGREDARVRPRPIARTTSGVPLRVVNGTGAPGLDPVESWVARELAGGRSPEQLAMDCGLLVECVRRIARIAEEKLAAGPDRREHEAGPDRREHEAGPDAAFALKSDHPAIPPAASVPPVAVVVRGMAWGETARVELFGSQEAAVRHSREHGGLVVAGSQVVDLR